MRKDNDPRWRGVTVPSLHSVVLRAQREDESFADASAQAWPALKSGLVWREYEAVLHPNKAGQIIGYRKVNSKAWFMLSDEGVIEGPFPTRKLCLHKLRVKTCTRGGPPGVYLVPGFTLFTRDMAPEVGLQGSELP